MHLCIFITRKLHDTKFTVDKLSLTSLFIPWISDGHIRFHKQVHSIVSVQTYRDMFRHQYATFRWYVCQL